MCEDWGWQGCDPWRRDAGGREAREDETPRPDRAERRRNGLAKLVPTLKPRNGLNDSWRVGGCGHSLPVSTFPPSSFGETPSTLSFLFPRSDPPSPPLSSSAASRARCRRKRDRGKRHGRKILPSFLSELPSSDPSRKLTPSTVPGVPASWNIALYSVVPRMTARNGGNLRWLWFLTFLIVDFVIVLGENWTSKISIDEKCENITILLIFFYQLSFYFELFQLFICWVFVVRARGIILFPFELITVENHGPRMENAKYSSLFLVFFIITGYSRRLFV